MSVSTKQVRVQVNGVEVGSLPLADYKKIQGRVRRDPRTYVRGLIVATAALSRTLREAVAALPVAAFTLVLLAALLAPDALTNAVSILQSASAADVTWGLTKVIEVARFVLFPMIVIAALARAFHQVMGAYNEDICREVRIAVNASAVGQVLLSVWDVEAEAPQSA